MISSLIIVVELGLFSLLLLLVFRVLRLNRSEPLTSLMPSERADHSPLTNGGLMTNKMAVHPTGAQSGVMPSGLGQSLNHPDRPELISRLHILASLQDRDCKQQGLDLDTAHPSVREYAVCWLYGVACSLGCSGTGDNDRLAVLVSQFASRKIGIKQSEALVALSTMTRQSASLACFRSGIEGAEFWKTHHFVPREKSLFEAVTSNAFV